MMSPEYIAKLARTAAREAARDGKRPMPIEKGDVQAWRKEGRCPIPNIGSLYREGWGLQLTDTRLVDKSGWGSPDEPAMTILAFFDWAESLEGTGACLAIIEEGQFQIVVGLFEKK